MKPFCYMAYICTMKKINQKRLTIDDIHNRPSPFNFIFDILHEINTRFTVGFIAILLWMSRMSSELFPVCAIVATLELGQL